MTPGREVVAVVPRERLDVDDDAALAVRHLERGVADLARLLLEDRADQLLLRRQLGLALRGDLADEQVAGADLGADADDAAIVEIAQRLLRAVRDVAGDLLVAELGRAGVDLVLVDVDRGEHLVLHEPLGEHDRVLEVVALERHERDEQVRAERQLAMIGRGAVGEHRARDDRVAELDDRLVVDQRALVGAHELDQVVGVARALALDHDRGRVELDDLARVLGDDHVARVDRGAVLEAGADERRLRDHQRHGLPLHVRAHQRAVRVVVLEERDHRRRDRDDLRRRDVHELDLLGRGHHGLALARAAEHLLVLELPGLEVDLLGGLRDRVLRLLGGVEVDDLVGHLAVDDLAVGRLDEAELGDGRHRGERADQADVRAFRRLDRAHAAVVGRMDVAHLDRRPLAGQPAGAERARAGGGGSDRRASWSAA